MRKQIGCFLGIITGLVILILLSFVACNRCLKELTTDDYFPGLIEKKSYHSEPGRDSVECDIYIYEDSKDLREALEYHEDFMPVTSHATEYIVSFICDFESWIEDEDIYSEYNLDKSCIDSEDYFYIKNVETYGVDDPDWKDEYRTYDVYYFDIQSMTLYYLHIDI